MKMRLTMVPAFKLAGMQSMMDVESPLEDKNDAEIDPRADKVIKVKMRPKVVITNNTHQTDKPYKLPVR
jgi:hypothetical protein